jgi:hypothetical protein
MIMWKAMKEVYGSSWRFMVAVPLVAAIPMIAELAQHAAEYRSGMYDSFAMAKATAEDPARMGLGYVKMLSLALLGYWVVRFMGLGEDRRRTIALPRPAVLLFAGVLLFDLAFTASTSLAGRRSPRSCRTSAWFLPSALSGCCWRLRSGSTWWCGRSARRSATAG